MGNDRCRWIRHRLPLMAGGELEGPERRRVERHLIGCADCRGLLSASHGVVSTLRAVARAVPGRAEAPSLWPALARQIRESRHAAPRRSFWDLSWPRLDSGFWPAMGLAMGLGGVMALALARGRDVPRTPSLAPIPNAVAAHRKTPAGPTRDALLVGPVRPDFAPMVNRADRFAPPPTFQYGHDLDRATPVLPGGRDPQRSY